MGNRIELYHKTVDLLLDAYNNDELIHAICTYCAVGNICKEASIITGIPNNKWANFFFTSNGIQYHKTELIDHDTTELLSHVPYSIKELMKIEFAFENSIHHDVREFRFNKPKEGQFIGLTAVLKVLAEIHEIDNSEPQQERLEVIYNNKLQMV